MFSLLLFHYYHIILYIYRCIFTHACVIIIFNLLKDREDQVELENKQRMEEDRLYKQFLEQREKEVQKVNLGLQEEWEIELEKLTSKFERELSKRKSSEDVKVLTIKHNKEKEDAKKNLTIKREKKKDNVSRKLLEHERAEAAALVEKHSKEMMTLIQEKRAQYIDQNEEFEGPIHGNGHGDEAVINKVYQTNIR